MLGALFSGRQGINEERWSHRIVVLNDPELTMVKRDSFNLDESLVDLGDGARDLDNLGVVVLDAGIGFLEDHGSRHDEDVLGVI